MEHAVLWLKFFAAAGVVVVAGLSLTKNAEKLATAMNWGHAFAGFVVLGWATSLPELTISLSAIGSVGSPSLATGNITGSVLFNLAILAVLNVMATRSRSPTDRKAYGVLPLGLFNLIMLGGTLLIAVWSGTYATFGSRILGLFLVSLYLLSTLYAWRQQPPTPEEDQASAESRSRRGAFAVRCLAAGGVILLAGIWLANLGDDIASTYKLEGGFVGTIFLATVSSLPELVTGLAAVQLGLFTMAAGSILGSNIFNLAILGACDLVYQTGKNAGSPLLVASADTRMVWNILAGLAMTVLIMSTIVLRRSNASQKRLAAIFWATMMIYVGVLVAG
jgi:cation:H+ antiporter